MITSAHQLYQYPQTHPWSPPQNGKYYGNEEIVERLLETGHVRGATGAYLAWAQREGFLKSSQKTYRNKLSQALRGEPVREHTGRPALATFKEIDAEADKMAKEGGKGFSMQHVKEFLAGKKKQRAEETGVVDDKPPCASTVYFYIGYAIV